MPILSFNTFHGIVVFRTALQPLNCFFPVTQEGLLKTPANAYACYSKRIQTLRHSKKLFESAFIYQPNQIAHFHYDTNFSFRFSYFCIIFPEKLRSSWPIRTEKLFQAHHVFINKFKYQLLKKKPNTRGQNLKT